MKISEITVGTRHRKDLGDMEALSESMRTVGLLHPVVVNTSGELIVGERRLNAAKRLGWKEIAAITADTLNDVHQALKAERDENTCRKDFTPTEAVAMAEAIEVLERSAAKERQRSHAGTAPGKNGNTSEKFSEVKGDEPRRALSRTAAAVGMSRPTLTKAKAVVAAARENPSRYGDLPVKMDETKKVDRAYKELSRRQASEGLPNSKTPHQQAYEAPSRKWAEAWHKVYSLMNGVRDLNGIKALTAEWNAEQRQYLVTEIQRVRDELGEWLKIAEKK